MKLLLFCLITALCSCKHSPASNDRPNQPTTDDDQGPDTTKEEPTAGESTDDSGESEPKPQEGTAQPEGIRSIPHLDERIVINGKTFMLDHFYLNELKVQGENTYLNVETVLPVPDLFVPMMKETEPKAYDFQARPSSQGGIFYTFRVRTAYSSKLKALTKQHFPNAQFGYLSPYQASFVLTEALPKTSLAPKDDVGSLLHQDVYATIHLDANAKAASNCAIRALNHLQQQAGEHPAVKALSADDVLHLKFHLTQTIDYRIRTSVQEPWNSLRFDQRIDFSSVNPEADVSLFKLMTDHILALKQTCQLPDAEGNLRESIKHPMWPKLVLAAEEAGVDLRTIPSA